jgi:hypothetical protein
MNTLLYTNAGALFLATLVQTALAASKVRLFQNGMVTISPTTTKADLVAAEASFTGYTAGGYAIATWLSPILAPEGGYSIQSPLVQADTASPYTVGNVIGGYWIQEAGGDVIFAVQFAVGVPMQTAGQGLPLTSRLVFPND